jgi:hypothetical protein
MYVTGFDNFWDESVRLLSKIDEVLLLFQQHTINEPVEG